MQKARDTSPAIHSASDLSHALAESQSNLASAKVQVTSLEVAVEDLKANCARLSKGLDAANSEISDLNVALQAEHSRSESLYKSLRVECHARQHADKRKQALSELLLC